MAGGARGERRTALRPDQVIFKVVTGTTFLLMAVTGLGYLALSWSTVVLLGAFVTVLQKKDFWSITVISMIQAARIFNDLAEHLVPNFVSMLAENIVSLAARLRGTTWSVDGAFWFLYIGTIILPFQAMSCVTAYLFGYSGPVACIAFALWRIAQRDYGEDASSDGNLMPALDIFYSLVLLQGGLYVLWISWPLFDCSAARSLRAYRRQLGLPDEQWCRSYLFRYLSDTRARCWREPASIRGRRLRDFAVDSLVSGSWEDDMLSGLRFLDAFVTQGADIRTQLLPFRPRIQKLIDALGWRQSYGAREMREAAARVVAHLAGDIHLAQFPGAMECISSLLQEETTLLLTNKQDKGGSSRGGGPNQLILQGLAILEGLAFDDHNCRCMCSTPGLLRKVMAPLSSANLMNDISNNINWADVVSRSLKVLYKLLQTTGKTSRRLRREICTNKQSMSNLESILQHFDEELQMGAMGILTQLALDLPINLGNETKGKLIKKQLQIFLADGEEGEEPVAELKPRKAMAGRTLVLLSTKIECNSALIMTIQNDIMDRLSVILDAKNTTYRAIAAQILENMCDYCDLDKQWIKETLLPKVLAEILSTKRVAPENGVSPPRDEENQQNSAPGNLEENHNNYTQEDGTEIQETSSTAERNKSSDGGNEDETTTTKLMREAFLSLALVIRDKLISADDFDDAIQKVGVGPAAFVAKMKAIVEDNCQETAESLRIVKLCCRIVEPMMQRHQYAQHFRNKEFVLSVSNASEIMSNLESCMLFAGTDFGLKNTMRPLLSDLKN
ncbi:uncharacterized protein LOC101776182 [Setaria italica]|nr:uncharacterized protein LOC101776182 [Setaria italica]XP_004962949.1 uncharacterized protein LOC101776182 [Setaria italica]